MLTVGIARATADAPDGNTSGQRPSIVPGVSIYPAGGPTFAQWLNSAAFAIPARGGWGNAGRAIATGPGLAQMDFSLQKNTRVAERKALVFRIEPGTVAALVDCDPFAIGAEPGPAEMRQCQRPSIFSRPRKPTRCPTTRTFTSSIWPGP